MFEIPIVPLYPFVLALSLAGLACWGSYERGVARGKAFCRRVCRGGECIGTQH